MKTPIKRCLARLGVLPWVARLQRRHCILAFHGVGDSSMPAECFERLLVSLQRHFHLKGIDELTAAPTPDSALPHCYLTFDDGLRNHFTVAYPLLRKYGIPAAFYVCPGLVATGRWIWIYDMRERLRSLAPGELHAVTRTLVGEALDPEACLTRLKEMPLARRQEGEAVIRHASQGFRPTPAQHASFDLMDWDEIRALDPGLITVGNHSLTHAMLDGATAAEADREVHASLGILEQAIGRTVRHFCYPDGRVGPEADARVRSRYATAVTTRWSAIRLPPPDCHRLPRLGTSPDPGEFWWNLARAPRG